MRYDALCILFVHVICGLFLKKYDDEIKTGIESLIGVDISGLQGRRVTD